MNVRKYPSDGKIPVVLQNICIDYNDSILRKSFQELKRRAGAMPGEEDAEESDEDMGDDSDDDQDDDIAPTVDNLKVFCVSATDYLILEGKISDELQVGHSNYRS